ncbi:MAG: response regulator [Myxococcota bacterium]|nr:response regulator [Myxococcota bacterium]
MSAKPLDGATVLVIEDHEDTLDLFTLLLEEAGARVLSAPSCERGLAHLDQSSVDVIVSDLAMPGVDGWECIRRVRGRADGSARCPALAVSGNASMDDAGRSRSAGFDAHLSKPVDPDVLIAKVRELLLQRATSRSPQP